MRMHSLREQEDFRLLFRYGARVQSPLFRLTVRPNKCAHARFAFIAPRAVAKRAQVRNLIRRRAREWARRQPLILERPLDYALLFKKEAPLATRKNFYEELARIFSETPRGRG